LRYNNDQPDNITYRQLYLAFEKCLLPHRIPFKQWMAALRYSFTSSHIRQESTARLKTDLDDKEDTKILFAFGIKFIIGGVPVSIFTRVVE